MLNLALRSCGFYINSTKYSKNTWGSSFFGENSQSCGSSHDTLFGCTNTTFTDQNGEPEGDVIFVNTNCTSNERLMQGQDPRYYPNFDFDLGNIKPNPQSLNVSISELQPLLQTFQRQDPFSDQNCFRACLCGYTVNIDEEIPGTIFAPYQVCNCAQILGLYYLKYAPRYAEFTTFLTSANITLFEYYGALPCDAELGQSAEFSAEFYDYAPGMYWKWVSDNDTDGIDEVVENHYECFDSFKNIQYVVLNYTNNAYGGGLGLDASNGICDS